MNTATKQLERRRARVRSKINGTNERPRLTVSVTNKHITAQIIDDGKGHTLEYVTTKKADTKGTMSQKAAWVGETIAAAAKSHKINKVVFDRAGRIYHGRLNQLAEAARKSGLEF